MGLWNEEDVSLLEQGIRRCVRCPARQDCQCPIPPEAKNPTEILIVGFNPGQEDDFYNRPFYTAAGRTLGAFLTKAGIARQSVWLTYLTKCFVKRAPTVEEIATCGDWLDLEFDILQPKIVLMLGDEVTKFFYPEEARTIHHIHGEFRLACTNPKFVEWQDTTFAATFSPEQANADPNILQKFLFEDAPRLAYVCKELEAVVVE